MAPEWPRAGQGEICRINDGVEDSYGRNITVCGDDGNRYRYLHLNNDTPGTDDGAAALEHVYAPGIRKGVKVARGQLIAYMGDSGNAEETAPHLHLDVFVPGVVNPWGEERINPYPSLMAALNRGDIPDGTARFTTPMGRLQGPERVDTAAAVSRDTFASADHVVIASAASPQDALVAGPLAAVLDGPVLITPPNTLAPVMATEIARLGATKLTVVGGVFADLTLLQALVGPQGVVDRIDGGTPWGTAALVAERVWELTGADGEGLADLAAPALAIDPMDPSVVGEPTLVVADSADRAGTVGALDSARVPASLGQVHAWLTGVDRDLVRRVSFQLDRRDRRPFAGEREWPYDVGGTLPDGGSGAWDITQLSAGDHVLFANIEYLDGTWDTVAATFTVVDGAAPRGAIIALGAASDPNNAWPDALAASWYGAVRGLPVLLTTPSELPAETAAAAATVTEVRVAGGSAAVPDDQVARLAELSGAAADRLSGSDRYGTAAAIAQDLIDRGLVDANTLYVATGHNWPDAMTAAPAIARRGHVFLLVHGLLGGSVEAERAVRGLAGQVETVVGLGGTAAITPTVLEQVAFWAL
jgi:putative cell wall-binding protein